MKGDLPSLERIAFRREVPIARTPQIVPSVGFLPHQHEKSVCSPLAS